ncbi:BAG family molecular chaperone regulator 4-like [Impatiens glandulifera]|uniref:BAG family molecular chaperone regulator 4-like n=1 Tax=Impatiens glandulifera TaxID=253017 RepID=UPI001FB13956|nr:BAG family molecular chaperone regulator 4-like [Impatiens glandulifera]
MDQRPYPNAGGMKEHDDGLAWEMRPGSMLVQKESVYGQPTVKINVSHGAQQFDFSVPSFSTFGDLKNLIAIKTGLDPEIQKLFFRGHEKEDNEHLQNAGVKDNAKLLLVEEKPIRESNLEVQFNPEPTNPTIEDITQQMSVLKAPSSEDKKPEESQKSELSRASVAIAEVRSEVDKLAEQVAALEEVINCDNKVEDKQFMVLTEFLMRQLLKLDSIEAEGEEKLQRKTEVRRIQNLEDKLDSLKERNRKSSFSHSSDTNSNTFSITTNWETFDSGMGSLVPPS